MGYVKSMKSRIGVLGGTFDPPHRAHLELARAARQELNLNSVIFMPAGNPWRKKRDDLTSAELRYAMVNDCLLYTSPSPRDATLSRMPSSA